MQLYSTKNKQLTADLKTAVLQGLPPDNGLYMPEEIPTLPAAFFDNIEDKSFQEIGYTICKALFKEVIPDEALRQIVDNTLSFRGVYFKLMIVHGNDYLKKFEEYLLILE